MKKQTKLGLVLAAAAVISVSVASLVSARGWVQDGADWYYVDNSGEYVTETIQSSGNNKFYLGEDGAMMKDYFLEDYNGNTYYFGNNGAMVTNTWVAIESSRVENQDEYVPDNYWYYFQASGKAMKGSSGTPKKTTVDGKKYLFNEYGQMCTGWVSDAGKVVNTDEEDNPFATATYYAGADNDGVLRSGWVTYYDGYDGTADYYATEYTNLYFYFNTSNNTKTTGTKKINGRTYAFDSEGVMLSGWDAMRQVADFRTDNKVVYFSGEDDGHQVKKGWVYAVPTADMNGKAYREDEEKYMYFNASGEIVRDQFKKINGKYYVFDRAGIMKTGLVLWAPDLVQVKNGTAPAQDYHYINTLDLDWATGEELTKAGKLRYGDDKGDYVVVNMEGYVVEDTKKVLGSDNDALTGGNTQVKMHLFGSDGARKTGLNNVEFSDDTYLLYTTASGDKGSGSFSKKYYSLGVQLKANADIRYGIYNTTTSSDLSTVAVTGEPLAPQATKTSDSVYRANLANGNYQVLNTSGALQKGQSSARKDADGNFWFIEKNTNALRGIYSVNVKESNSFSSSFRTKVVKIDATEDFSKFKHQDADGNDVYTAASTSQLVALAPDVLDQDEFAKALVDKTPDDINWDLVSNGNNRWYFTVSSNTSFDAYAYQSDINDQTSKWIPFGVYDNANKTVVLNANEKADSADDKAKYHGYEVTPNNDYFTNCYWIELK